SPALHLGASRILVIGVSSNPQQEDSARSIGGSATPPSLAQISGHMLNSTFIDNLEADMELLERLNLLGRTVLDRQEQRRMGLKPVDVLTINPSQSLDRIAARHRLELPRSLRFFLRGPGGTR